MTLISQSFTSRNENGDRQVEIELAPTFVEWILRKPGKKLTFVQKAPSSVWYHKGTGKMAGARQCLSCLEVVEWYRQQFKGLVL
jgi:hypothetical protein